MKILLKQKSWWGSILTVILVLMIGHIIVYYTVKSYQINQTIRELRTKAEVAKAFLQILPDSSSNKNDLQLVAQQIKQRIGVRVTFINSEGTVIADSDVNQSDLGSLENHISRPEVQLAMKRDFGSSYRFSATVQHRLFYVALQIRNFPLFSGFVRLSYYSSRINLWLHELKTIFVTSFLLNSFAIGLILSLVFYRIFSPYRQFEQLNRKITIEEIPQIEWDNVPKNLQLAFENIQLLIEKLQDRKAQLENGKKDSQGLIDLLETPLTIVDRYDHIISYNKSFRQCFSPQVDDLTGRNIIEVLRAPEIVDRLQQVRTSSLTESVQFDYELDHQRRFYNCDIHPFLDSEEERTLLLFTDISELKKLQAIRRDFVTNVSHEMKTPISAIIGFTETLVDHPEIQPEQTNKYIQRILIQAKRMQELVADLLYLSELEKGTEIRIKSFRLKNLVHESISNYKNEAERKKQTVNLDLPDFGIMVEGDYKRLRMVLDNLLQNAIAYTQEQGIISIGVEKEDEHHFRVLVKDNGIGIDEKFHQRIFQRFYRVDESRAMHALGTGLGLAIARHLVESYNEKIGVDSQPGKGSTFWFTLTGWLTKDSTDS